jgi:hypothetical protein
MSIIQPILTIEQINEITDYINHYRSLNQAPSLTWDNTIQEASNNWSHYLLTNDLFQHSGNQLYGENLAYFKGYGTDVMVLLKKAVDAWYNEISLYDFSNPGFSQATGHFTSLVWVSSTNYAIAISIDTITTAADIVFNCSPPGNIEGQYKTNVLPLKTNIPIPPPILPPIPVPSPVPSPVPPLPLSNKEKIIMIINELYNIILAISRKKNIYSIIGNIQKVISELDDVNISPITNTVINLLTGVIFTLQKRKYNTFAITTINNIINQLKQYL